MDAGIDTGSLGHIANCNSIRVIGFVYSADADFKFSGLCVDM